MVDVPGLLFNAKGLPTHHATSLLLFPEVLNPTRDAVKIAMQRMVSSPPEAERGETGPKTMLIDHREILTLPDCRYRRNAGYPAGGIFVILLLSREGDARMDARPKTRQVDRERKTPSTQVPRGAKQIVIPMTQQQYDDIWHDADRVRSFIEQCARSAPELFPAGFDQGYCLHGFGRESLKLSGLKLRKIVLANGASYWLRPIFIFCYMTGTVDELAYPLLLAAHGVPFWLLTLGFGHNDMFSAEARDVEPEYAPETVNTDGWASTRNAFQTLFPLITVVLCFLHGFLKIRDRCRKACELHR